MSYRSSVARARASRFFSAALVFGALSALAFAGACGASSPKPPSQQAVGDLGVDVAGLNSKLPAYIDSISAGDLTQAYSGYVLVAQHDQPLFSRGYAAADRDKHSPNTADTSFRVGSVTKQFTAAAILRLEQDGLLSVNDPIGKHLAEYPAVGKDITIHQLLNHTSGIPSYTDDPAIMARRAKRFSVSDLLATFWDKPLVFAPGSRFAYSNSGYIVLGAIIERVSGKPYATYLNETLFAPAGMIRTVVGDAESATDRAEGYKLEGGKIAPADPIDMSLPYAAGAIRSTANDLVRWHRALAGDSILGPAAKEKLYKPGFNNYAYGWVVQDVEKRRTVLHGGGIDGFSTIYWRVPESDLVVVAWSNVVGIAPEPVGQAAVVAALGGTPKPVEKVQKGTLDPAVVARVTGEYAITDEGKAKLVELSMPPEVIESVLSVSIGASANGITAKPVGQASVELLPSTDGSFFAAGPNIRIRFQLPSSGNSNELTLEQGGLVITYRRATK